MAAVEMPVMDSCTARDTRDTCDALCGGGEGGAGSDHCKGAAGLELSCDMDEVADGGDVRGLGGDHGAGVGVLDTLEVSGRGVSRSLLSLESGRAGSLASLASATGSTVDWPPSSRLRLYSFPWRRRSTASHILNHRHLRIRRRFR